MKKIVNLVVSLALIMSCLSITAMAADVEPEEPEYNQNTGLYSVGTEGELLWVAEQINSGEMEEINVRLTSDITVTSENFAGIGTEEYPFSGEFLGDNCTITVNLQSDGSQKSMALFPYVGGTTSIEDLIVAGSVSNNLTSGQVAAGFVGIMVDGTDLTIKNCTNQANISGGSSGVSYASGFVGISHMGSTYYTFKLTMINCVNYGDVVMGSRAAGLLVYYANGPLTVSGCANYGDISSKDYGSYAAGLIGEFDVTGYTATIADCMNYGDVTAVYSTSRAGGIFATGDVLSGNLSVSNCGNEGNIVGGRYVGGIAGVLPTSTSGNVSMKGCYNTGNIEMTSSVNNYSVGGITGLASGTGYIEDCYNMGSVVSSGESGTLCTGGIVGRASSISISNVYNAGSVLSASSSAYVGAVVGYDNSGNTYDNCYYLTSTATSGYGSTQSWNVNNVEGYIISKTEAELKALAGTLGEGFKENTSPDFKNGYPVLVWEDVPVVIKGDADGNGEITAADAVIVLRYAVSGDGAFISDLDVDMNDDGEITAADAVMILRMTVSE